MTVAKLRRSYAVQKEAFLNDDGTLGHQAKLFLKRKEKTFERKEICEFPFPDDNLRYRLQVYTNIQIMFSEDSLDIHVELESQNDREVKLSILDCAQKTVVDPVFKTAKLKAKKRFSKISSNPLNDLLSHETLIILFEINMADMWDKAQNFSQDERKNSIPKQIKLNLKRATVTNTNFYINTDVKMGNIQQHQYIFYQQQQKELEREQKEREQREREQREREQREREQREREQREREQREREQREREQREREQREREQRERERQQQEQQRREREQRERQQKQTSSFGFFSFLKVVAIAAVAIVGIVSLGAAAFFGFRLLRSFF